MQNNIEYMGYIISIEGVGPDHAKISEILNWPAPINIKQLRGFQGITCFYRKFVQKYSTLDAPLTALIKKDSFEYNKDVNKSFESLKKSMPEALVIESSFVHECQQHLHM